MPAAEVEPSGLDDLLGGLGEGGSGLGGCEGRAASTKPTSAAAGDHHRLPGAAGHLTGCGGRDIRHRLVGALLAKERKRR
jgi:hypothetical protein